MDRDRGELNYADGDLDWRFRNKLQVEREIKIGSYHPTPYANVEVYFDSKYQKWTSTVIETGSAFPVREHIQFDLYYEHQNNTKSPPNRQVNAIGLVLNLSL